MGLAVIGGIAILGGILFFRTVFGAGTWTTQTAYLTVTGGATGPVVSGVVLNAGNDITLTANTTTTVLVTYSVSNPSGCGNIFGSSGNVTTTIYRTGVSSTCTGNT